MSFKSNIKILFKIPFGLRYKRDAILHMIKYGNGSSNNLSKLIEKPVLNIVRTVC